MNLVCAYCGFPFPDDRVTAPHHECAPSAGLKWGVFAAALVLPIVGLVTGSVFMKTACESKRSASRLWLIAGLCSSLVYGVVLAR